MVDAFKWEIVGKDVGHKLMICAGALLACRNGFCEAANQNSQSHPAGPDPGS